MTETGVGHSEDTVNVRKYYRRLKWWAILIPIALACICNIFVHICCLIEISMGPVFIGVAIFAGLSVAMPIIVINYEFIHLRKRYGKNISIKKKFDLIKITLIVSLIALICEICISLATVSNYRSSAELYYFFITGRDMREEERDSIYNWEFDEANREWFLKDPNAAEDANGGSGSYNWVDQGQILADFALNEYNEYTAGNRERGSRGGKFYCNWFGLDFWPANSKGKDGGEWAWCSTFVGYCIYNSGLGVDTSSPFGNLADWQPVEVKACTNMGERLRSLGFEIGEPRVGSIILYNTEEGCTQYNYGHAGIVVGYDSNTKLISTVEGNCGKQVKFYDNIKWKENRAERVGWYKGYDIYNPAYTKQQVSTGETANGSGTSPDMPDLNAGGTIIVNGRTINLTKQGGLLDIEHIDGDYGQSPRVDLSYNQEYNGSPYTARDLVEATVYGECGTTGFVGCCLVAQAIRDVLLYNQSDKQQAKNYPWHMADQLQSEGYLGLAMRNINDYKNNPNTPAAKDARDAVAFIFDCGGYAVKHKIWVFCAYPSYSNVGDFHRGEHLVCSVWDEKLGVSVYFYCNKQRVGKCDGKHTGTDVVYQDTEWRTNSKGEKYLAAIPGTKKIYTYAEYVKKYGGTIN